MKAIEFSKGLVTIQMTKDEVGFLGNAINETMEALSGISIDHWKKEQNAFKKNLKDFNGAKDYLEDECDGK